jgi:nicotinamidase-related amidase
MSERLLPVDPASSALLVIDMQNLCATRGMGLDADGTAAPDDPFYSRLERLVVPNAAALIGACRGAGIEVIYTVIRSLTRDGRDRSLDHKLSGYHVPPGTPEGEVIAALAPAADEIVLPKTASGVFDATNIDYLLRNMGISRLGLVGVYTNQCIESAARVAADRGYHATVVEDACAGTTPEAHAHSIDVLGGYGRVVASAELLEKYAQGLNH